MNGHPPPLRLSQHIVTAVMLLAHLLAATALIAFGWRAGGFALHGPASYGYLLLTGLATVIFFITLPRNDEWVEAGRIVIAPWLALVAAGLWFATAAFGAKYAPYGAYDDEGLYALTNAAYVALGCGLALALRWPRLLLAWAMAHGLALVLSLGFFGQLRYGALVLNPYEFVPWLFVPVLYGLAGLALGWRPTRRHWRPAAWLALAGLALAVAGAMNLRHDLLELGHQSVDLWINLAAGAPGVMWFTAFVLPIGWYAWRARREWDAPALEQAPAAPPWMGFVGAMLVGTWLAGFLLSPERLPRAGAVQGWISTTHIVPTDAWLPTLGWSAWLFAAVRWLLVPVLVLGLTALWRARRRPAVTLTSLLLWAAMAVLVALALEGLTPLRLIPNIVLSGIRSPWFNWGPFSAAPFMLVLGLLFAARVRERALGSRSRAGLVLFVLVLLGLFVWRYAAGAWTYARFLFFPLLPWARVADYAPASPTLLAGLGLALHLLVLLFGITVVGFWLHRLRHEGHQAAAFGPALRRLAWISGVTALALAAIGYGLTTPRPLRVVPAPGATGVPLDTLVLIEIAPPSGLDGFLAGGFIAGLEGRYADTGEHIPGTTGASGSGLTFDPDGLLRPGAVVEIVGRWSNKRPYTLRFTTAGEAEPAATPLPLPAGWPSAVATAAPE